MPAHAHDPVRYAEIAETLRKIASDIRFDDCRVSQLNALADGFERLAKRVRHEQMDAAAD
jgi:oligoribonuclease NrnB/cAMP/cGMP phosphodiesterase (DHH superfamily)